MQKLSETEVAAEMKNLPHWSLDSSVGAISREYVFKDFIQAFGFMTQIAIASEKGNHHPEWSNVYQRVRITWTTHDANGLTMNDIGMAQFCDTAFASMGNNVARAW